MKNWKANGMLDTFEVNYATKEEGKKLITTEDDYTNGLTQFDLDARCQHQGATKQEYLTLCRESVRDLLDVEIMRLESIFYEIQSEIRRHGMVIPQLESINIVKTTAREESLSLSYTRGNTIFIASRAFALADSKLEQIMTHELFHILTRSSFPFKRDMYQIIGFTATDKPIDFSHFKGYSHCSNPDAAPLCNYITLGGRRYMMVMLAPEKYKGGNFFGSFIVYFAELDSSNDLVLDESGNAVLHPMAELQREFIRQIGSNTSYLLDPEEILAENFRLAVLGTTYGIPSPEVIDGLRSRMRA